MKIKDKALAIAVKSPTKEVADIENPDTWNDSLFVYMVTPQGEVYIRKEPKSIIIKNKMADAQTYKVESMEQYLNRVYGKVVALKFDETLDITVKKVDNGTSK